MFNIEPSKRKELLNFMVRQLEEYYQNTKLLKVASHWNRNEIQDFARFFDLEESNQIDEVLKHILDGLTQYAVQMPHPNYFGLFNPRSNFVSILGDLITAYFNPQLAAWKAAPFANEIERYLIQKFGQKFGYKSTSIDGTFCTGGAESNLTAILCALNQRFPNFDEKGVFGLHKPPIIYCSQESHHSIVKAAKITGLGRQAVRPIAVNNQLQLDLGALQKQINSDLQNDYNPFMLIGTAGTTGAGAIDNLTVLKKIARQHNLWFHVDAAYGGAAIVSKKLSRLLHGIDQSDSITLDFHKGFSVPMGASIFLTQKKGLLHQVFRVNTKYMYNHSDPSTVPDPYVHSIQWSRRFIGLKVYLPLVIYGWQGYGEIINHQFEMGILLRKLLLEKGWKIRNDTQLPIVCFTHSLLQSKVDAVPKLAAAVVASGKAWVSTYAIAGENTLRACITNYSTTSVEVKELIHLLEELKESIVYEKSE